VRIFLLDNYDSFTFNLVHLLEQFDGVEVDVFRNDQVETAHAEAYDRIVLSPGPGIPDEAGILKLLIKKYFFEKKILGVCLGLQAIAEVAGGKIFNMNKVLHGVSRPIKILQPADPIFASLPAEFNTARYHSWAVATEGLPAEFRITSTGENDLIMSLTHENELVRGVQFHPESILTEYGKELMQNWLYHC
jgi:anthranilate synthase component II